MRRKIFLILLLSFFGFNCSVVLALDPMGPPSAGLKQRQFSAGAEYSYSRMDITLNHGKGSWSGFTNGVPGGSNSGKMASGTIKNLNLNKVYAKLGYGITDNWEIFLRLGGANVDFNYGDQARPLFPVPVSGGGGRLFPVGQKGDGDNGFAIGLGTKATFYERNDLKLGGLFQISWSRSKGKGAGTFANGGVNSFAEQWSHSVDVEITEIQVALGPTYKLAEKISIYGGPFFHFIDGDIDGKYRESGNIGPGLFGNYYSDYSYDIDESSIFGGYLGTQIDVTKDISFNIEYQHTAFADALGMNLLWRF